MTDTPALTPEIVKQPGAIISCLKGVFMTLTFTLRNPDHAD